jgi:hypothetical protein
MTNTKHDAVGEALKDLFVRGVECTTRGSSYEQDSISQAKRDLLELVRGKIKNRIELWRSHGTEAPLAGIYGHLTLVGELEVILDNIERLFKGEGE